MAKKPNKGMFQVGNFGTCKKWENPEVLQADINEYFEYCKTNSVPYTIEGLCDTLDCDRKTLLNYEKKEGYEPYFHTIKKAKLRVQRQKLENGLSGKSNATMTIFDLKNNHGYKDKTETDITSGGEKIKPSGVVLPDNQTIQDVIKEVQEAVEKSR